MIAQISAFFLGVATFTAALPASAEKRAVPALNQPAFQEAQQQDATATRAFSSVEIKVRHPFPCLVEVTRIAQSIGRLHRDNVSSLTSFLEISAPI
jgi:hypothetical protein